MITQEFLKEFFDYNPETGLMSVKKRRCRRELGAVIGSKTSSKSGFSYLRVSIDKKMHYIHRLAFIFMTGSAPKFIDHKNGNRMDNSWGNLRACTNQQNSSSRGLIKNSTGYKGVTRSGNKFAAQITHHYRHYNLGTYATPKEAHEVYFRKSKELNGEFANPGGVCV